MAYTKTQLIKDALLTMGVLGASENQSADDQTYMSNLYDQKIAEWTDRDLVYWPNTGDNTAEIPAAIYTTLRNLLVNEASNAFGKSRMSVFEMMEIEDRLLKGLRRHMQRVASGFPTKVDTF